MSTSKSIYFPTDHTADEWRAMAKGNVLAAAKSFEECDTDGFLSQWASNVMASVYRECATLAEDGGFTEMAWPMDLEGNPVQAWRWVQGKYGSSVMIDNGGSKPKWWNPSEAKGAKTRLARDTAKGYVWGIVRTEAVVGMAGNQTCVQPIVLPKNDSPRVVVHKVAPRYAD